MGGACEGNEGFGRSLTLSGKRILNSVPCNYRLQRSGLVTFDRRFCHSFFTNLRLWSRIVTESPRKTATNHGGLWMKLF